MTAAEKGRCAIIAAALDRGDLAPWRRAESSLGPEERGLIWDLRQAQVARAAQSRQGAAVTRPAGFKSELRLDDLDFWLDAPDAPIDDDPPDDQPACSACNGRGKDAAGNRCAVCGGSGKVAPGDDDGNEDDDDEFEDD